MLVAQHSNTEKSKRITLKIGEKIDFDYPCSSQIQCSPYSISLPRGYYFLEVYGASGQDIVWPAISKTGGTGGYSSGVFHISSKKEKIYLYIGGHTTTVHTKSYNGGGSGNNQNDGNGGGATDFRTKFGKWNESLESRIIVAGGGGGSYAHPDMKIGYNGGNGGGETGQQGEHGNDGDAPYGTQSGCIGGSGNYIVGGIGYGPSGMYAGGGGGYWGGGNAAWSAGSGGSGYIGKVFSLGKYEAKTDFSDHKGSGNASITLLAFESICNTIHLNFHFHPFIFFVSCLK